MKLIGFQEINKINEFFKISNINYYRREFIFAEPCSKAAGKETYWSRGIAFYSMLMVAKYRDCVASRRELSQDLIDWISSNKDSKMGGYDLAMKLMKVK